MRSFLFFILIQLLFNLSLSFAQEKKEFTHIEELMGAIRAARGDVLYKDQFFKLKKLYEELKEQTSGRLLTEAEKRDVEEITTQLRQLREDAERVRPFLSSVLTARDEALLNDAADFAPDYFNEAEKELKKVAEKLRKENPEKVQSDIEQTFRLYRQAHFQSIRNKLLGEVRILIQESKDLDAEKLAPRTLNLVYELLHEVENILDKKQFTDPTLQEKATLLASESQHLLYLVQLTRWVKRDETALEEFVLKLEEAVRRLANLFDYNPQFYDGIEPVLANIEISVKALQEERDTLATENQILKEVKIWREKNELYLRLNGIEFEPGKINISEKYKSILELIGKSIRDFPASEILVRLGQLNQGNYEYNVSLATQRARAAQLIIQSAGFIPDNRIRSEGIILNSFLSQGHAILEVVLTLPQ